MNIPENFKNILIVRTDRIGDLVLTTPAIKAIAQSFVGARITLLVVPATVALVEGNPYIDAILVDERQGRHAHVLGFWRLLQEIRLKKFDLAVIFHTKRRYNLLCAMAGIPCRLGYANDKFGFLLTCPVIDTRALGVKHEAQYCLDLLQSMRIVKQDLSVFIPWHKESESWCVEWMRTQGLCSNDIILIHPGASDTAKCWPSVSFAQLLDALSQRYLLKIVLIGSDQTVSTATAILRQSSHPTRFLDLTGKTSLAQTISLLRRSRLLISNDSGPVHLAAGVGISVIALFMRDQPGINPERWKPLGSKGYVLKNTPVSLRVADVLELTERILKKDNQYEIF